MGCGSSKEGDVKNPGKKDKKKGKGNAPAKPQVIFVLGGPGSGKGTQCEKMVNEYCFVHLSTGDLLRAERQKGGPDAQMIEDHIKEGKLVPSDLLVKLIKKEFEANGNTGRYLLDGFPRSLENLNSWNTIIGASADISFLLMIECSFEVMEQRLLKRGETSGRADDNPETIKLRFETFTNETQPIVQKFETEKKVHKVNSEKNPEEVYLQVKEILGSKGINPVKRAQVVFVLGGPGSGKGTQCANLVKDFEFVHLSTGDLLREEKEQKGPHAEMIENYIKEGKLVPSELLVLLIRREFLLRNLEGKYLIDGFPRSQDNFVAWNKLMTPFADIQILLFFECSFECMEKRLLKRGKTSGRSDDNPETIKKRFDTFQTETKPILQIFQDRGQAVQINAEKSVQKVYSEVKKHFKVKSLARKDDGSKPEKGKYVIFVLGGPGSGKGTQCAKLVEKHGFAHLSTGDLLRDEQKKGGKDAQQIQAYIKEGKLVPSEMLIKLIQKNIEGSKGRKFLLDGFPRNEENFDTWLLEVGNSIKVKYLLYFECSKEVMQERLIKRGESSGRADDNPETIQKRLQVFVDETEPMVKFFEEDDRCIRINSEKNVDEVYEALEKEFTNKKLIK